MNARIGLALAVLFVGAGCTKDDGKRTVYPVDAVLTMDGKAFGPIAITLVPLDKEIGRTVVGQADEAGRITFTTYDVGDGVPAGMYRVAVDNNMFAPPRPYPAVYRDQAGSPLQIEIKPEQGQTLELAMNSQVGGSLYNGPPTGPGSPDMGAAYRDADINAGATPPTPGDK